MSKNKGERIKSTVRLTPEVKKMVEVIRDELYLDSNNASISWAISLGYKWVMRRKDK